MRRFCGSAVVLLIAVLLAGCGQKQRVGVGAPPKDIFNDAGGYAGDMALPPKETYQPNIEDNIQWKEYSNSQDATFVNQRRIEAEREQAEAAKPKLEPIPPPDTRRDDEAKSNPKPVLALELPKGVVYLELWPDVAPKHCARLIELAEGDFYGGILIHRVEPGFVVQMGDPLTKFTPIDDPQIGTGGSGANLPAEFSQKPHLRGTLSMARANDPDSADSQFFICLDRAEPLDGKYTVFGQVLGDGMTLVDEIQRGDRISRLRVVHK